MIATEIESEEQEDQNDSDKENLKKRSEYDGPVQILYRE